MTSNQKNPHNVDKATEDFEPSSDAALASYMNADWVGLTDFYDESLCLLLSRLRSPAARAILLKACTCEHKASVLDTPVNRHGGVDSESVKVSPVLAMKMDRLTAVDKTLYSVALRGFFSEITDLEARLGHRIMCPHVLMNAQPKLAYITNVTALYELSRSRR